MLEPARVILISGNEYNLIALRDGSEPPRTRDNHKTRDHSIGFLSNHESVGAGWAVLIRGPPDWFDGIIRFHHVPHVLLKYFPSYADGCAAHDLSSVRLINPDFVAKADFYFD
jgi:hypothetical protein